MKNIVYLLLLLMSGNLFAQKDTLYFNSAWNKTTKTDAAFFRPMPLKKVGEVYQVRDFYANGNIQMEGFWSDVENEVLEGKAIWYHENGQPYQEQELKNGRLHGKSTYYTSEGFLRATGEFKNGNMWTGTFQRFCCPGGVTEFVDGQKKADLTFYKGSAQLAKKEFYKNKSISAIDFFDKTGKSIGQITYKNYEASNGKFIGFYMDGNQATRAIAIKNSIEYKDGLREGEVIDYDEKGVSIAKGLFKNDIPWRGSFYFVGGYYNELTSYKEGLKDGPYLAYDRDGNLLKEQEYKNGELIGLSKTKGAFQNKICECEFKNGKPFTGEVCEDVQVKKYVEGIVVEVELYGEEPEHILKTRTLYEDDKKIKETSYHNNKSFELSYKDYNPYNGVEYSFLNEGSTPYVNGEKHGEFFNNYTSYYTITMSGNYVNGELDGPIIFKDSELNRTTTCTYEKGIPVSGVAMFKKNYITTYKNGKKHGLETSIRGDRFSSKAIDSMSRNYVDGQLEGKIEFYKQKKLIATGVYKNNKPYTGVFHEDSKGTVQYINEYAEGALMKHELHFRDILQTLSYRNGKKLQTKFYNKEQLLAEGLYKDDQPYEGGFIELEIKDPNYYHERYTLTLYKKGKKNGEEQLVNFKENKIEKTTTYLKNKKVRKVDFIPFKDNDSLVGFYKKGKPFSGYFLYEEHENKEFSNTVSVLNYYENGQKKGHQFYTVKGSRMQRVLDSISYVKGKPYQGVALKEQEDGVIYQQFYEKGKLTKTHMHMFGVDDTPYAKIDYTNKGFTTSYLLGKEFIKEGEIAYTNTDKTEGFAMLYRNNIKVGSFKFSKDEITETQFSYQEGKSQVEIHMDEPNIALIKIETSLELMTLEAQLGWSDKTKPTDFIKWEALLFKTDGIVNSHLKDKKTPIATCIYKDGEEYEGIITRVNENSTYTYRKYEKGEMIEKKNDVSEEQLIALMKE